MDYIKDPKAIETQSLQIIRAEADLSRFSPEEAALAERLILASADIGLAGQLVLTARALARGGMALKAGAPVICDVRSVQTGIAKRALPMDNEILCGIGSEFAETFAIANGTTRAAAGLQSLADRMRGAIVAIGNAPTALFQLLQMLDGGAEKPALILAFPFGFVGAEEAKAELIANDRGIPFIALPGRAGGAALAAAAVNALASADKA